MISKLQMQNTSKQSSEEPSDITLQISLDRLRNYFSINVKQSRSLLVFSILSSTMGLLLIIMGIVLVFSLQDLFFSIATLSSGIIIDLVSWYFYYTYKNAKQLEEYVSEQLEKLDRTRLAFQLVKTIEDPSFQQELQDKLIFALLKANAGDDSLQEKN